MPAGDNLLADPVVLPTPPPLPTRTTGLGIGAALPAVGSLGAIGFLAFAPRSPFIYAAGGLIVLVSIAMVTGTILRVRRERHDGASAVRSRYLDQVEGAKQQLAQRHEQVRRAHAAVRITADELAVPIAATTVDLPLTYQDAPDADAFCRSRARRLAERGRRIDEVPVTFTLPASLSIDAVQGEPAALARQLLRAVLDDLSPHQLRVAVLTTQPHRWRALRWAPHHRHPSRYDDCGALRLVEQGAAALTGLLSDLDTPVLLIVDVDAACSPALRRSARWVVQLGGGGDAQLQIDAEGRLRQQTAEGGEVIGELIRCSLAQLEAAARAAARRAAAAASPHAAEAVDLPLRPLLGHRFDGSALHLDLREAQHGGAGPHGMLIGITGSGKSEVLRSIVAGLVSVHSSDQLSLLLVDFKGGATFAPFERLPQVSATITNLEADPALVGRMTTALAAELRRRQAALREAEVASIDDLEHPMPRLMVIIDEFSELLSAHPQSLEVLVQIGRLGRSLGVHLLIAAQRLDEGRIRGLDTHLTYRIALRTANAAESRAVIGTADAAELTNAPGHGYLRCGSQAPQRFRARYTGANQPAEPSPSSTPSRPVRLSYRNGPARGGTPGQPERTVLTVALSTAAAKPGQRRTIWVPPPQRPPTHDDLYPDLTVRAGRGYGTTRGRQLDAAIGWADRPDQQRIEVAGLDLTDQHAAIIGTTRSGVTTIVAALGLSLALRSTPQQLHLYIIDAAASQLSELAALPHCAGYADLTAPRRIEQILRRVSVLIDERHQAPSAEAPAVVLLIDGYPQLLEGSDLLETMVLQIAARGLAVDVHLVLTAHSWLQVRARLRDLLAARLELRLGDPVESQIDRRAAALLPRDTPGRGLTQDGHHLYAAQPDTAGLVERIRSGWDGAPAPGLIELPATITVRNLSPQVRAAGLAIGADTATQRVHTLDEAVPLLLVIGDSGTGRTSILRSLAQQDAARGTKLLVIDPRRRLLGDLPTEAVLGYAATPAATTELITGLVDGLSRRMPPADITAERLAQRSWWSGPNLHLIVDDYDLLTLVGAGIDPLRRFLPYAADLGLRVSIVRRAAGAAAALHDPTLSVLRDLGADALLLSRATDEGPLLGVRPSDAPWATGVLVRAAATTVEVRAVVEPRTASRAGGSLGNVR